MDVETKDVSLKTLSVTIRAIQINGKQMTLSVFKQLPQRGYSKEDEVWGFVRYEHKSYDSNGAFYGDCWLVASKDGVLYRERRFEEDFSEDCPQLFIAV
jgi:hypothetical protein